MDEIKICEDCEYYRLDILSGPDFAKCAVPHKTLISRKLATEYCSTMRVFGGCGKEGKLFKKRMTPFSVMEYLARWIYA